MFIVTWCTDHQDIPLHRSESAKTGHDGAVRSD
jgi:hypothetical protein